MPDDFFSFTLGHLARNFSWNELNVVYKTRENEDFMVYQKDNLFAWLKYNELEVVFIAAPEDTADIDSVLEFGDVWERVVQKRGMSGIG